MKRLIVLFCAALLLFTLSACGGTQTNALISTASEGTPGFTSDESFRNLFDLDVNTKWCVNPFEEAYVIWETSEIIKPTGYIIVTANDSATYKGRNPASWTLYGSYAESLPLRGSNTWEVIDRIEGSTELPDTNYTEHYFDIDDSEAYDYYMLIIDRVQSGTVMQISEFALIYKGGDYAFFNSATGSTLPHSGEDEDYDEDLTEDSTEPYDTASSTTQYTTTESYEPTSYTLPDITTTTRKPVTTGESYFPNLSTAPRFYSYLSESEKTVYNQMCDAIENFTTAITPTVNVTTDSLRHIHECILSNHPEYFWADRGIEWSYINGNKVTEIRFKYQYPKSVVPTIQLQIDKAVRKICEGITADYTEYDIALHVYEQLINTIDYDTVGLQIQKSPEGFQGADDLRSIYGAFIDKRCVCVGYAYATQYILRKYGIECSTISNEVHAWNLVKLEGDYYYIDTTWGDPSNTDPLKESSDNISYAYFCMTTEALNALESHEIPPEFNVPECTATKCNYFIRSGLYFEYLDTERLQALFDKSFANGGEPIMLMCADASCYRQLTDHLFEEGAVWDYIREACSKSGCEEPDEAWHTTYDSNHSVRIYYKYF